MTEIHPDNLRRYTRYSYSHQSHLANSGDSAATSLVSSSEMTQLDISGPRDMAVRLYSEMAVVQSG
jgi:hypothetical protein